MKFSARFVKFIIASLGVASISSCDNGECMYGTPNADYEIKGEVTDDAGSPLEGINVYVSSNESVSDTLLKATTNAEGEYKMNGNNFPFNKLNIKCIDPSGKYQNSNKFVDVKFNGKGKDEWYKGKADIKADFKLIKNKVGQ